MVNIRVHMVGQFGMWVCVLGELCKTACILPKPYDLRFGAARLHIVAQLLGDMEHSIVGLFLCNISLFVLHVAHSLHVHLALHSGLMM